MSKRIVINVCLALGLVAAAGGCATRSPSATQAAADNLRTNCVRDTTRLPSNGEECRNVPGASYSQQSIQQTGQTNMADALRKLDPRIE
jgi:hypothetical protein